MSFDFRPCRCRSRTSVHSAQEPSRGRSRRRVAGRRRGKTVDLTTTTTAKKLRHLQRQREELTLPSAAGSPPKSGRPRRRSPMQSGRRCWQGHVREARIRTNHASLAVQSTNPAPGLTSPGKPVRECFRCSRRLHQHRRTSTPISPATAHRSSAGSDSIELPSHGPALLSLCLRRRDSPSRRRQAGVAQHLKHRFG